MDARCWRSITSLRRAGLRVVRIEPNQTTDICGGRRNEADVELAIAERVAWFNTTRLRSAIRHLPPEEFEAICNARHHPSEALAISR